ncbi:MAG: hypothetical protein ACE5G0_06655 [Rhodothermales bacterium]
MVALTDHQLDAQLDNVVNRIQHLRQLDLSLEDNLQQALEESQNMLGALALYRKVLRRAADYGRVSPLPRVG